MFSQIYYLIRSRKNGRHLVAHPTPPPSQDQNTDLASSLLSADQPSPAGFILLFTDHADALSYLNTHAQAIAQQFAVESLSASQLPNLMQRWGFSGIGMVRDPLLPHIEFMARDTSR